MQSYSGQARDSKVVKALDSRFMVAQAGSHGQARRPWGRKSEGPPIRKLHMNGS